MKQCSHLSTQTTSYYRAVIWLSFFLTLLLNTVNADVREFTAEYDVKYKRMRAAEVILVLEQTDKNNWHMSRTSQAIGLARLLVGKKQNRTEHSWFAYHAGDLTPSKYTSEQPGAKKGRKKIEIEFGTNDATVKTDSSQSKNYAISESSQDKVSAIMAVMLKMQSEQENFVLPVMERKGESMTSFEVLESSSIKTPAGTFNAVLIEQKAKKRITKYWLAEDYDMVPVKILHQEQDKESAEMLLKKIDFSDSTPFTSD